MEKQKKEPWAFPTTMKGMGMSPGLSADLSRLKMELKALRGILGTLDSTVRRAGVGLLRLNVTEHARAERWIPDEHLVSYA